MESEDEPMATRGIDLDPTAFSPTSLPASLDRAWGLFLRLGDDRVEHRRLEVTKRVEMNIGRDPRDDAQLSEGVTEPQPL
jgi:hypothetical protein